MAATTRRVVFIRRGIGIFVALGLLIASSSRSEAALLNLVPGGSHVADITASFTTATYNAATKLLSLSGSPLAIDYDQTAPPDATIVSGGVGFPTSYTINVFVSNLGALLGPTSATDLNIIGRITSGPHPSAYGTLLSGRVIAFGYADLAPHRLMEFVFQVTGGSQAPQFGPTVAVVFDSISGFNGTFSNNFTTSFTGNADNFAIPEPTSGLLFLFGLAGFAVVLRLRNRGPVVR